MRSFAHIVRDPQGLHARSCVVIVHEAAKWQAEVAVSCGEREGSGKSMSDLLALGAHRGDAVVVSCQGLDENDAANALQALMRMSI